MEIANYINSNGELKELLATNYELSEKMNTICPNCREDVSFVNGKAVCVNGELRKKHFKHKHGTKRIECEDYCSRLVGIRNIDPYKNTGLSLYLLKDHFGFSLNVGFFGISETTIEESEKNDLSIKVISNKELTNKKINQMNFMADQINFMRIDDISKSYTLEFTNDLIPIEIEMKWNKYIDGIGDSGAIFMCNENGGRKVKSSEGLEINKTYYLLVKKYYDTTSYSYISFFNMGKLEFGVYKNYYIYEILIKQITEETRRFSNSFNMGLYYSLPKVVPLWPPCRIIDRELIYNTEGQKFFMISSDDKEKRVAFSQTTNKKLSSKVISSNRVIFNIFSKKEEYISLGSAAAPFEYVIKHSSYKYKKVSFRACFNKISNTSIEIQSTVKMKVIRWKSNIPKEVTLLNGNNLSVCTLKRNEKIEVLHGLDRVTCIERDISTFNNEIDEEDILLVRLLKQSRGNLVPVSSDIKWLIIKFKEYPKFQNELRKIMKTKLVPRGSLNLIKLRYLQNKEV